VVAAFVIFLREGVEASMIVAILLAYLNRTGRRDHFRDVLAGVGAAFVLATVGGVTAYLTIRDYAGSRAQTIFETVTFLLAAVILTYMTFWMRKHGAGLSGELEGRLDAAVSRPTRYGLGLLAFQAVGREGLETVVFTLAIAFSTTGAHVLAGGAGGIVVALAIAVVVYRLGHRLRMQRFFQVVGALLMVFAAALLVDAVQNMQELGWLPFLTHPLWNTGRWVNEDSAVGDILHSFFGYAAQPTVLQLATYLAYVAVVLVAFFGLHRKLAGRFRAQAA
jgi:high-affinity iron transporter